MSPIHADISRYGIPFTVPVMVRGLPVERREGLLLGLRTPDGGATAFGEIAPLPGLHDESLEEAERSLGGIISTIPDLIDGPIDTLHQLIEHVSLPPSVATGVEMAVLNFRASLAGTLPPLPATLRPARRIAVNALLAGTPETVLARAETGYAAGFRTFKLKVQSGRIDEAIASVRAFHESFGEKSELRLDANQSLTLDEAIGFGCSIPGGSVTYIEEPVQDAALIPLFHERTGILSALDETLWQKPELLAEIPTEALGALILKPNRLGGILKSLDLAALAGRMGLEAVFSSAFESGVSLGMYALMASLTSTEPPASGLDTISYLDHDLLDIPFATPGGSVDPVEAWQNSQQVDNTLLKPVSSWIL
ncbi:MAG: o-succinylbenzoate synthase [Chlorobiaceae bacterium]|nr:o-succinylbenzoate synthase [Chlorobiaceae bacterium]